MAMGLYMRCPLLVTIIIELVLVGRGSCERAQRKQLDAITTAPAAVSTNGWRPMLPPSDWPESNKLNAVGHPVLGKLQAHLEAAEKKRQYKYEVYAPAPPSILGSLSVFGHATVQARQPAKHKKKNNSELQSSESRVVYSSLPHQPSSHVRFPEQYPRPDQIGEQQRSHFYLQPPVPQAQDNFSDTLLVPPPQIPDHVSSNYYYNTPQITSYQSQKLGDFSVGIPFLQSQAFSHQAHNQYTNHPVYNQNNPETQHTTNEQRFPTKLQQPQSFSTSQLEYLTHREVPKPEENGTLGFQTQPVNSHSFLENAKFIEQTLEQLISSHQSHKQQEKHKETSSQDHFPNQSYSSLLKGSTHHGEEVLPSKDAYKSKGEAYRPHDASLILTPSQTHNFDQNRPTITNPLSDGEILHGKILGERPQFQTPSPEAELFIPSQQSSTDKHPTSVLGFSVGVSPTLQNPHQGSEQYFENPFVISQSPGEKGRITRPYFKEELQTNLAQDAGLGNTSKKNGNPHLLGQRLPPDVTEDVEEVDHFLPTLSPAEQPFLKKPPYSDDTQDLNTVHPHHSGIPQVFPADEVQVSEPEQVQTQDSSLPEEEQSAPILEKPRPHHSRKVVSHRYRYPTTETVEELHAPHESQRQNEVRSKYRRPASEGEQEEQVSQLNEMRSKHRRPASEVEQEEQVSYQNEVRSKHRRPATEVEQEEQVSHQNEVRTKHRRPASKGEQEEQVSQLNEVRSKHRRPASEVEQEEQVSHQNEVRSKHRRPASEVEQEEQNYHETQPLSPPRPHRPGAYNRPPPVEENTEDGPQQPAPKYRHPQHQSRRPTNHHVQTDDVSTRYRDEVRPQSSRRPGTRIRVRPAAHEDYVSENAGTSQHQQDYYKPHRRRRPTPPPQYLDATADGSSIAPSAEDDIYTSQYGATATEDETQETAPVTQKPYTTTTTTTTTTTARPRRGNPYNRNRGKDKYNRQTPTTRTTTPLPETTPATPSFEPSAEFDPEEEYNPESHNDIFETAVHPSTGFDLQKSQTVTQIPFETDESYTTFIIPTSTTPATPKPPTSTSTTTSTSTESPLTTQATAASTSSVVRLRPRLRYGVNATRPRFSVKDYRERLVNRTKAPEEPTTAIPRVRYPTRTRGTYHFKKTEEEATEITMEPSRGRYRPKDSRYGSTSTTTALPEVADTTERYKASTSRYRPGTGKYYSHYRSTTALPEDGASTPRMPARPKGVFSAARRPYPLRTRTSVVSEDSKDSETSVQPQTVTPESTSPHTDVTHWGFFNTEPSRHVDTENDVVLEKLDSTPDSEDQPEGTGDTGRPISTQQPEDTGDMGRPISTQQPEDTGYMGRPISTQQPEDTGYMGRPISTQQPEDTGYMGRPISTQQPEDTGYMGRPISTQQPEDTDDVGRPISTQRPEEDTPSPSQRVADLTSSASLGGFFKTSVSTSNTDARRITMATEDPILPIEAFFPVRGNKNYGKSR